MSVTPDQIAQGMLANLAVTCPGLSCELGTPERKIIDAVAQAISAAYISNYLTGSLLDIETKSGLELDQFCLVPGTPVTTPVGVRAIETLRVGDEVTTHTGKTAEVLATSTRKVDEDVVTIRTAVGVEYTMTKNHPVWVTRRSEMNMLASQVGNWRRDGSKDKQFALRLRGLGNKTVWDSRGLDRDFIPAGEVMPGDIVWGPDKGSAGTKNNLSVGLKRLLGYYLSEGHIHHRERSSEIGFSFHRNETEYQDEVESLLRSEWGVSHVRRAYPSKNSVQLICYNTKLAHWLEDFAGKGAQNKHIPFGMDDEDWTPLLATYWRGDGTAAKQQSLRAKTVSPTLAQQVYDQLVRLGLSPRMTKELCAPVIIMGRKCQRRDTWQISVDGESAKNFSSVINYPLRHQNTKNYSPVSVTMEGFVGSPVVKVVESRHQGFVHNIEVAGDNSYELPGSFGVHNCGIFGFGRLQGKAAEGVISIELSTPLNQNFTIQKGTQFYTKNGMSLSSQPLYFASTQEVILTAGTYSIDVPVKCTSVGVAGNVPPDSVNYMGSLMGSSSCTNLQAMNGGVDVETDEELRHRFENTLLRNVSGTPDWYKALCLQNNTVSRAAVYGPISTYRTQIVAPGTAESNGDVSLSVMRSPREDAGTDVAYVWPGMESVFINLGQSTETFYSPTFDYEMTSGTTIPPSFRRLYTGNIEVDSIVDVEFEYTSEASRNDPVNGITNKVDIYVDGTSPFTVAEATSVSDTTIKGSSDNQSPYYTATVGLQDTLSPYYSGNFERVGSPGIAQPGNRFTRLNSCPIISFPDSITIGSSVFQKGSQYWLLKDKSKKRGSPFELSGIEWAATSGEGVSGPDTGSEAILNYVYNQTPEVLTAVMKAAKQICTDVMVHQADYRYIMPCFNIQYTHGYDVGTVNNAITNRLQIYFQSLGFGAWIDISKLCLAVQQVLGVYSVSLTTDSQDGVNYGIRVYANSNDTGFVQEETSFKLEDRQVAQFLSFKVRREATP